MELVDERIVCFSSEVIDEGEWDAMSVAAVGRAIQKPGIHGQRAADGFDWRYYYEEDFPVACEIGDYERAYALCQASAGSGTYRGDAEFIDPDGLPRGTCYNDFHGYLNAGEEFQVFSHPVTLDKEGTWKIHITIWLV